MEVREAILFRPLFCVILIKSVDACLESPKLIGKSLKFIIGRVIHLITIQLHCSNSNIRLTQSFESLTRSQLFFTFAFDCIMKQFNDKHNVSMNGNNNSNSNIQSESSYQTINNSIAYTEDH